MCTYATATEDIDGSAKGPGGNWFRVGKATVYYDHPVHAMHEHTLNVDLFDPEEGPGTRVGLELSSDTARRLANAILSMLDTVPSYASS
jgi:hypothetical protein